MRADSSFRDPVTRLFLVRHGQTEGNVDRSLYKKIPDHAIRSTPKGIQQEIAAGVFLRDFLSSLKAAERNVFGRLRVWNSSYYRTRETAFYILHELGRSFDFSSRDGEASYQDEPFLIEQQAGLFDGEDDDSYAAAFPKAAAHYRKSTARFGRYYAKSMLGESRHDVSQRVKQFFGTLISDRSRHDIRNIVVVTHGVTVRAFTMNWMRYTPEWMDAERNPGNCWIRYIEGTPRQGYIDHGYIHGEGAPLRNPDATQSILPDAENVFMLKPQRPNALLPKGIKILDPFNYEADK